MRWLCNRNVSNGRARGDSNPTPRTDLFPHSFLPIVRNAQAPAADLLGAQCTALAEAGKSLRMISRELGVSYETVRRHLNASHAILTT
jgi:DNA-binding CsgD family transcriptional regulator